MTNTEAKVVASWKQAALDLGLRFVSPFVAPSSAGFTHEYLGLVCTFGGHAGAVIRVAREPSEQSPDPVGDGYYRCILGPGYERYDRQLFINTLNDWQFFGPASQQPEWYSGRSKR